MHKFADAFKTPFVVLLFSSQTKVVNKSTESINIVLQNW